MLYKYQVVAVFVIFIFGLLLLRYWMDTQIIVSESCSHTKTIKAEVVGKLLPCYCYLKYPDGSIGGHSWLNPCNIGEIIEVQINNYSCDDLLR